MCDHTLRNRENIERKKDELGKRAFNCKREYVKLSNKWEGFHEMNYFILKCVILCLRVQLRLRKTLMGINILLIQNKILFRLSLKDV